jgi:hypothetical protein
MAETIPSLEDNPCGRATKLREIRDRVIVGGSVIEAEQEAGHGGRRRAKFSPANLDALDREIAMADAACNLSSDGRPRRFAIGGRP